MTDRSDSWADEESATRRCSASRWATESSNTWLWQIDTKQHNKQSISSIRRAPSQSGYQGHFQGRQGWEKIKCIFITVTVCLSFFIQIFLFPFLPHIYTWYLVRIVDNRHFLPELQIWGGIAPHSSQSLHCKYKSDDMTIWPNWAGEYKQCFRKWNLVLRTWGQKLFNGEKKDFWVKKGPKKDPL